MEVKHIQLDDTLYNLCALEDGRGIFWEDKINVTAGGKSEHF